MKIFLGLIYHNDILVHTYLSNSPELEFELCLYDSNDELRILRKFNNWYELEFLLKENNSDLKIKTIYKIKYIDDFLNYLCNK